MQFIEKILRFTYIVCITHNDTRRYTMNVTYMHLHAPTCTYMHLHLVLRLTVYVSWFRALPPHGGVGNGLQLPKWQLNYCVLIVGLLPGNGRSFTP